MKLAIYGSRGLGREVLLIVKKINELTPRWDEFIFIDDFEPSKIKANCKVFNFDTFLKTIAPNECEVVIAVGEPSARDFLFNRVKEKNYSLPVIIHPNSNVNIEGNSIGEGTVICYGSTLTDNVSVGNCCYIQSYVTIGHDIKIGNFSVIGTGSQIGGATNLGDRVYMGFLSGVKEKTDVGSDCIIAAGAIVFQDLPKEVIVVGNPGRIVKKNLDKKVFK